jgi:transmembrane sensor
MAVAACLVATVVIWKTRPAQDAVTYANTYSTDSGAYQRVPLPDGSVVELNADTELRVQFTDHRRDVALTRGEAHFTVAKNPARPFFVSAGKVGVRAVGTAFNVRHASSAIDVLVTEGKVEVSNIAPGATTEAGAPVYLGAGQRAIVANDTTGRFTPVVSAVDPTVMRAALVWQNAPLIWLDVPLADVVKQFNQRNRVQLAVEDADLAQRVVGGAIRADQVETFVRLLEESRDIAVERPDAEHIVLRKAR